MSQNANGDTPGFAGLFSTGSGGVLAVLVICILAWAVFTVIVGGCGAAGLRPVQPDLADGGTLPSPTSLPRSTACGTASA